MPRYSGDPPHNEGVKTASSRTGLERKLLHGRSTLERLCEHPALRKSHPHTSGPLSFVNPTRAHFDLSMIHRGGEKEGAVH
jgi:hypothetical protein